MEKVPSSLPDANIQLASLIQKQLNTGVIISYEAEYIANPKINKKLKEKQERVEI